MASSKMTRDARTDDWSWSTPSSLVTRRQGRGINARARALLIADDVSEADTFRWALRALHLESVWARFGAEGLAAIRHERFDLVFVDADLPDMQGVNVIRTQRAEDDRVRYVLLADVADGVTDTDAAGGAIDILAKPLSASDVIVLTNTALGQYGSKGLATRETLRASASGGSRRSIRPRALGTPGSIAERWAHLVLRTIDAKGDPRTIANWAKSIGVSRSVLSECCRLVHVSTHDARDFARLVRAICHSGDQWQPEAVLDLADVRTLRKLLTRAGVTSRAARTPTLPEFLDAQDWIREDNPGLVALRALLFGTREITREYAGT